MTSAMLAPVDNDWLAEIVRVPVGELFVDSSYQRPEIRRRVAKLVQTWNWRKYMPIIVARRNGRWVILDGQQRVAAARELGIEELIAVLLVAGSPEIEAEMFLGANDATPVSQLQKFHALIRMRDPEAIRLLGLVEASGFEIAGRASGEQSNPFTISALGALQTIDGYHMVAPVLRTIYELWGDQPHRQMVQQQTLLGVMYALNWFQKQGVERAALIQKLRPMSFKEIWEKALKRRDSIVGSTNTASAFANILVDAYNYKRRHPIPAYGLAGGAK